MSGKKSKLNQFSKSTSSMPYREFPAATSTFSVLVIILSIFLGFLGTSNTYASSINITLSGNVSLNLIKDNSQSVFGTSAEQTATVTSDHFTGYTLTIAGSNDTGKLENNDKSKFLSSIDTAISENIFKTNSDYNDHWGFLPNKYNSIDNSSYQPSPTTIATTIDVTNTPTSNDGNNYTLALGAKVTPNMALDSYGQTFILAATGNGYDYHIGYSDVMDTLPADQYGNTQDSSVNLSATEPTKAGYTFAGWCTEVPIVSLNGTTCPVGADVYQAGDPVDLNGSTANNMELYAIWDAVTFDEAFADAGASKVGNYYRMQDMTSSICNAVAVGQEGTLVDNRSGNKTYTVGKLKDGRCWMLDNLALGGSSAISLTTSDTNIQTNWTLPAATSSYGNSYTEPRINATYINTVPTDAISTAGGYKIGIYYNYCAASAGTVCSAAGSLGDVVIRDICPMGWRLPSAGELSSGEFDRAYYLYQYESNWYNAFRTAMHLPLSGVYYNSGFDGQGDTGVWWSNSIATANRVWVMLVRSSFVAPNNHSGRHESSTMRCIAK